MPILLCYDGSDSAKHAITVAHATLGHQPAILLHVWNPPVEFLADAFSTTGATGGPSIAELDQAAVDNAESVAQEGHALARHLGLAVEDRVERADGNIWHTILAVADEVDSDLIVVGTRGATAVQSALLGSTSNAVVHHSERPVLVVPGPAG